MVGLPGSSPEPLPSRRWPVGRLWNVLPKYTIANALQRCQPHAALGDTPPLPATLCPFIRQALNVGGLGQENTFSINFYFFYKSCPGLTPHHLGSPWFLGPA